MIPWTEPGWFEQAAVWIHAQLAQQGIAISGPIEQPHAYPWSTVLHVPSGDETIFFKAVSPFDPFEPVLVEALGRWHPDDVPTLLALDSARGWMLMRDSGHMLRQDIRPIRDLSPWFSVLPRYAELQIALAGRVGELLALGVPDRRLALLPQLYAPLLADVDTLRIGRRPGITPEQHRRLLALAPRVAELCAQLAEYGIPESLKAT